MRQRFVTRLTFGIAIAAAAFYLWPAPKLASRIGAIEFAEVGARSARNLLAVQPFLTPADYRDSRALHSRLAGLLSAARERNLLTDRTVVVFPEHIGTWLVAGHAPAAAYAAPHMSGAALALIAGDPFAFARAFFASNEVDRTAAAMFRSRSPMMARAYQDVFADLTREYAVSIVAGSIVLEAPTIADGRLSTRRGPLYNVSAVFNPDGSLADHLVVKAYPIPSERRFAASASEDEAPVFLTPAGRLGLLICADSWHPDRYAALRRAGAEFLAVPGFIDRSDSWSAPWGGYVTPEPGDISRADIGAISEGRAWGKYAMPGRIAASGAGAGVTVFLRGRLWDMGADGRTLAISGREVFEGADTDGAAITAVWL